MRRRGPRPIALDHNFPKPILQTVAPYLPEVSLHWIHDVDEGLADLQDHDLVFELHRRGFSVLLTGDHHMVNDVRVLVALEQTRMSLLTARNIGDDPVFATGVVLRDLLPLLRSDHPQGLVYLSSPSKVRSIRALQLLTDAVDGDTERTDDLVREHGLLFADRRRYPDDDARLIC